MEKKYRYEVSQLQGPLNRLPQNAGLSPKTAKKKGDAMFKVVKPRKPTQEKLYPFMMPNGQRHPLCYVWVDASKKSLPPAFGSEEQKRFAQQGSKHGMIVFYPPPNEITPIELGSPAATRAIRSIFIDEEEAPNDSEEKQKEVTKKDKKKKPRKKRPLEFREKMQLVNCTYEFFGPFDQVIVNSLNALGFIENPSHGDTTALMNDAVVNSMVTADEPKMTRKGTLLVSYPSPKGKKLLKKLESDQAEEYKKVSPTLQQKRQGYISYIETVSEGPDVFGHSAAQRAQEIHKELAQKKGQGTVAQWARAVEEVKALASDKYKEFKGRMPSVTAPYDNATGRMTLGTKDRRNCNIYGFIPGKLRLNKKGTACIRNNMGKYKESMGAYTPGSRANIVEGLEGDFGNIRSLAEYQLARDQFDFGPEYAETTRRLGTPSQAFLDLVENPEYYKTPGERARLKFSKKNLVSRRSPFRTSPRSASPPRSSMLRSPSPARDPEPSPESSARGRTMSRTPGARAQSLAPSKKRSREPTFVPESDEEEELVPDFETSNQDMIEDMGDEEEEEEEGEYEDQGDQMVPNRASSRFTPLYDLNLPKKPTMKKISGKSDRKTSKQPFAPYLKEGLARGDAAARRAATRPAIGVRGGPQSQFA